MAKVFVQPDKETCRLCYTCVRKCPAKALRVENGHAEVIETRCINCGHCVRVCRQDAMHVIDSTDQVRRLLSTRSRVAICVDPSFPAAFDDVEPAKFIAMLRAIGFQIVGDVAFGADLVAQRYQRQVATTNGQRYLSTICPATIGFVERYYPNLVSSLSPIVSPMIATARAIRELYGRDVRIVYAGPCVARKAEAGSPRLPGDVEAALTFTELRSLLDEADIRADQVTDSAFDWPHGGAGTLFPISGGLFQAANLREDLLSGQVAACEGRHGFTEAIKEFNSGDLDAKLLEVLCCYGCYGGAGIDRPTPPFSRRSRLVRYARQRTHDLDKKRWREFMVKCADLDLSRRFAPNDQRVQIPLADELTAILHDMGKFSQQDELDCGACGYETCREYAVAISKGLAEPEMCRPYTIQKLREAVGELAISNKELATTKEALMHSEKLASMGQLAAGIAHEVNNPLGVVIMYSHLLLDDCQSDSPMARDLSLIAEQANRCKTIVSGLLDFARQNRVVRTPTRLDDLIAHALELVTVPSEVNVQIDNTMADPTAEVDADQLIQVLTNLLTNAFAAMDNKGNVTIRMEGDDKNVKIAVQDTGCGIPPENIEKVFEPFFTTKPIGKGTGLGLAVAYGIIKMHRGELRVESNADPLTGPLGSTFTLRLPRWEEATQPAAV